MKNEFIPYEESLALKELGYIEKSVGWYRSKTLIMSEGVIYSTLDDNHWYECVLAPLYQQAFRWFREKYGLVGWVEGNEGKRVFMYCIESPIDSDDQLNFYPLRNHEEAELECLKELIEIVKSK